jgi:hypothetical protein
VEIDEAIIAHPKSDSSLLNKNCARQNCSTPNKTCSARLGATKLGFVLQAPQFFLQFRDLTPHLLSLIDRLGRFFLVCNNLNAAWFSGLGGSF